MAVSYNNEEGRLLHRVGIMHLVINADWRCAVQLEAIGTRFAQSP